MTSTTSVSGFVPPEPEAKDDLAALGTVRRFSGSVRGWLWGAFLLLTLALFLFPKTLTWGYSPIDAITVLDPALGFGAFYTLWVGVLALLFVSGRKDSSWEGLALISVFVLGYRGLWDLLFGPVNTADAVLNSALVEAIAERGFVPFGRLYADMPGLHLATTTAALVTAAGTTIAVTAVLLLLDLLVAGLFYLVALRLVQDARLAGFSALLAMEGNIMFPSLRMPFYPGFFGMALLGLFLLILLSPRASPVPTVGDAIPRTLLLSAVTITHFVTSLLFAFLLLGIIVVGLARRFPVRPVLPAIMMAVVVPFSWLAFVTVLTFRPLIFMLAALPDNLRDANFLSQLFVLGRTNLGPAVPLWATAIKFFWLALLFGGGLLAAMALARQIQKLNSAQVRALGALLGMITLNALTFMVSTQGFDIFRFLVFSPYILAPFLILALGFLSQPQQRRTITAIAAAAVVLAFPTYLAYHSRISFDIYRSYERAPARVLARATNRGEGVRMIAPGLAQATFISELPQALFEEEIPPYLVKDEARLWSRLAQQLERFERPETLEVAIYVISPRMTAFYKRNYDVEPDHPNWQALVQQLFATSVIIYDNGFLQLYSSVERRRL